MSPSGHLRDLSRQPVFLLALVGLALLLPAPVLAEETEGAAHSPFSRHDLALFVGVTEDRSAEEFTQGVEYEYRFTTWLGPGDWSTSPMVRRAQPWWAPWPTSGPPTA